MADFTLDQLFNCCTDHAQPDCTRFDCLELGGCIDANGLAAEGDEDHETMIEGGYMRAEAAFFTVYGHIPGEGLEAITDVFDFDLAMTVAKELASRAGLPMEVRC